MAALPGADHHGVDGEDRPPSRLDAAVRRQARNPAPDSTVVTDVAEDGSRAHSLSYVHTTQVVEGFPLQLIFQGRYEDTFRRVAGQWRFASRVVHADGIGDMSDHQRTVPS